MIIEPRQVLHAINLAAVVMLLPGCTAPPPPDLEERMPLKPVRHESWRGCFQLENDRMKIVVVPALGRIMYIGLKGGSNLLRQDPDLKGRKIPKHQAFANFGGDWLWPVSRAHWDSIGDANWPPPGVIGEAPWKGQGWINRDGSQSCLIMRGYGDPVHAWVTRLITLDQGQAQVRIRQRILQTGPSQAPLTLWNITQLTQPVRVFLPVSETQPSGFVTMLFDPPPETHWQKCGDTLIYDARREGQCKIGVPGSNTWIAAETTQALIIERTFNRAHGPYPDGGCPVEMYASSEMGYVEIETLSPERMLAAGESIENTLVIECHPFDRSLDDCEASAKVMDLLEGISR